MNIDPQVSRFREWFIAVWLLMCVAPALAQFIPQSMQTRREMRGISMALQAYLADHGTLPLIETEACGEFIASKCLTTPVTYLHSIPTDHFKRRRQREYTPFEHFLLTPRVEKAVIHLIALTALGWYSMRARRDASNVRFLLMVPVVWLAVCAGAHYFYRSFGAPPISVPNEHWFGKRLDYQIETGADNRYILLSLGPDGVRNMPKLDAGDLDIWVETPRRAIPLAAVPFAYDATNGTLSRGDIVY